MRPHGDRATLSRSWSNVAGPIDVRGGDWGASALNHAVFRGDPGLTDFLLAHGANWHEAHGHGSDVLGTLSWASVNEPTGIGDPDWIGCARALMAHGLPKAERDPSNPERVLIDGRPVRFSEGVTESLVGGRRLAVRTWLSPLDLVVTVRVQRYFAGRGQSATTQLRRWWARQIPSPRFRPKLQSTLPPGIITPPTCRPSCCSSAGRQGTSWKPRPSSIMAKRPDESVTRWR